MWWCWCGVVVCCFYNNIINSLHHHPHSSYTPPPTDGRLSFNITHATERHLVSSTKGLGTFAVTGRAYLPLASEALGHFSSL